MNKYGAQAKNHWMKHLPHRYEALKDPESYFSTLGEEIEDEVDQLSEILAGNDPPNEMYLDKVGRLNEARMSAEAQVMQERALLPPEEDN
jgi:hypothetical protein